MQKGNKNDLEKKTMWNVKKGIKQNNIRAVRGGRINYYLADGKSV